MSESWKTKWGARRVRRDPPTLTEAFAAAACLTEDRRQQAEIAADLMGVTLEVALAEAGRLARDARGTITVASPSRDKTRLRTVVIERRPTRRQAVGDTSTRVVAGASLPRGDRQRAPLAMPEPGARRS